MTRGDSRWQSHAYALLASLARNGVNPTAGQKRIGQRSPRGLEELRARQIDSVYYLASEPSHPIQRVYDKAWGAQRRATLELVRGLNAAGVRPMIIKGADILERYYGGRGLGYLADVDIVLEHGQLEAAKQALYGCGYRHAAFDQQRGGLVDLTFEQTGYRRGVLHYELAPFLRIDDLDLDREERAAAKALGAWPVGCSGRRTFAVIQFDVHLSVAVDLEADEFWARAVPSPFDGAVSMSHVDHLWFLTCRYYNEIAVHGKSSLRDLVYVLTLLSRPGIDWDVAVAAAKRYEIRPALYYVWTFAATLAGRPLVPRAVLEACDPRKGSRVRDWGWQLPKLFDELEPCPIGGVKT